MTSITGDQSLLKQINRMALVRAVQRRPALSRADLAKHTGLTKSTVSLLVQELIDEGWLAEGSAQTTGALGRRPTPLFLSHDQMAILGGEIEVDRIRVVAVSLEGELLDVCSTTILEPPSQEMILKELAALITGCASRMIAAERQILGLGLGVPGAVDQATGLLKVAPNLGWRNLHLADQLRPVLERCGLEACPIFVQNEADVAALGAFEFGERPVAEPLIYISLGVGVGAGIIANDRLFTGCDGFAGEVGHSILQVDGPRCSCGRKGCAEAFIGLRAICDRVASCHRNPEKLVQLAHQNDPEAVRAIVDAGHHLGILLQNLWTAFNPGRMVVGGPTCNLGAVFMEAALESLQSYADDAGLPAPEVCVSPHGQNAVSIGAAAMVLHHLLRPFAAAASG